MEAPLTAAEGTRQAVRPSEDIFSENPLLETAVDLFLCDCSVASGRTAERHPTFEVRLRKDPELETAGYRGKDEAGKWHTSFKNLKVEIYPVVH